MSFVLYKFSIYFVHYCNVFYHAVYGYTYTVYKYYHQTTSLNRSRVLYVPGLIPLGTSMLTNTFLVSPGARVIESSFGCRNAIPSSETLMSSEFFPIRRVCRVIFVLP